MNRIRLVCVVLFVTMFSLISTTTVSADTYEQMVLFGDSLSDHYGIFTYLNPISGEFDAETNPNGARQVWSNGDVWAEYLAETWGATLKNNAIAGAMTKGHENTDVQNLVDQEILPALGMEGQVNRYLSEIIPPISGDALYIIWIGSNDLLVFLNGESDAADLTELTTNAATRIVTAFEKLYDAGARNFLFMNVPDLGKTPALLAFGDSAAQAASSITSTFNESVLKAINAFTESHTDAVMNICDTFTFLDNSIASGVFSNTTGTYLVLDEDGNDTGDVNEPAEDYLFWDQIHPTTIAHSLLADTVADQLDPEAATDSDHDDDNCFIQTVGTFDISVSWISQLLPYI